MGNLSSLLVIPNFIFLFFFKSSFGVESITQTQSLNDGKTLVSSEGSFELGFFSPGSSKNRYLGIWYKSIPVKTVVWVANRISPINDSSGSLMINNTGSLLLLSQNKMVVWSTNSSRQAQNPLLQLLDSGNLVLRDEKNANPEDYLWQSFDYPTDTLLAGMKLGWDLRRGLNRRLTAWKNRDDPSPGDFTFELELYSYPESYIWKGSVKYYRTGPWNGIGTSGAPSFKPNQLYEYKFVSNEDEVYYTYNLKNKAMKTMAVLNQSNYAPFQRCVWLESEKTWETYSASPKDHCDSYNLCGANGNCLMTESPVCQCLKGFKPKSQKNWELMDWAQGCERNTPLSCQDKYKDGFVKYVGLKVPDTTHSWVNTSMNLKECRVKCLNNCSCMAYTNTDIRGRGSGCVIWFGDLLDIRQFPTGGQTLYIRMQASELELGDGRKKRMAAIVVASVAVVSGMLLVSYYICSRKRLKEKSLLIGQNREVQEEDMELPVLDLSTISRATDGFSVANKLGEGGFGPVYRGVLADGQEVAVKRLSRISGQGPNEFRNEVKLIAKLQHRNLVKLLGCCIEGEEKMLVYEYMPNKSLDSFLFDQTRGRVLDWSKRFQIICGIARGLLYLHQDSRLRIIHRDLKASNVLLDSELKPKISDFGMAKTFGGDQTEGNTNRVVGTYGYMAPEYAFDGLFSTKSDVFSFGILLLEIVSGKKSRGLYNQDHSLNLIGYAWKLWNEVRPLDLLDACLGDSVSASELLRCVHVSLLCVQQRPEDRPGMSSVVLMLGSEIELPQPKEPGFLMEKYSRETFSSTSYKYESSSTNEISNSILEAR
ncbi:hypothetical protein I3760_11G173900 [Carya illinoinensis]|nr:hypothetical protein I3760_11G173900 [Carya illinoinensis]